MRVRVEVLDVKTFRVLISNITNTFSQGHMDDTQYANLSKTKIKRSIKCLQFFLRSGLSVTKQDQCMGGPELLEQ